MRYGFASPLVLAALCITACATSHVMVGKARPPISPDQVQICTRPPPTHFEEVAQLSTSSQGSFSFTAQGKTDAVIARLKAEAAKLGEPGARAEILPVKPATRKLSTRS